MLRSLSRRGALMGDALLACHAVRCAELLPSAGWHCRRGFRPRGRLTFFAGAKKVSQESTLNTTRRAVVAVASGRCAPAGGAHRLAQQALDKGWNEIAAARLPTRLGTGMPALDWRWPIAHRFARCTCQHLHGSERSDTARTACLRRTLDASGPARWRTPCCDLVLALVERLLRETVRATGRSAAIDVYGHHRTPRCIQGAFLAYFLCTSKESESAAGPKPPPAMQANTRQKNRAAHAIASTAIP